VRVVAPAAVAVSVESGQLVRASGSRHPLNGQGGCGSRRRRSGSVLVWANGHRPAKRWRYQ
jgi:hypothetical protein